MHYYIVVQQCVTYIDIPLLTELHSPYTFVSHNIARQRNPMTIVSYYTPFKAILYQVMEAVTLPDDKRCNHQLTTNTLSV